MTKNLSDARKGADRAQDKCVKALIKRLEFILKFIPEAIKLIESLNEMGISQRKLIEKKLKNK